MRLERWLAPMGALLLAMRLAGCEAPVCPCGASIEGPVSEHDFSIETDHQLADGCACSCGDGPIRAWPFDDGGTCEYDGDASCVAASGQTATLTCY